MGRAKQRIRPLKPSTKVVRQFAAAQFENRLRFAEQFSALMKADEQYRKRLNTPHIAVSQ